MFQNVSQIWSTTAGFEGFAGARFQLIRNEKKVINNNNSPYTFWNRARAYIPIYFPTSRINVGFVYLENFQKIFTSYKEQERENCKHCRATGHKINPHNVTGLSEGKRVIKHHLKKAIAIKQRNPLLVAMSLDWTSRPFSILFWKYVTVFSHPHYVPDCI